jgi:hypothetical protein
VEEGAGGEAGAKTVGRHWVDDGEAACGCAHGATLALRRGEALWIG